jgi:hypothetical protein
MERPVPKRHRPTPPPGPARAARPVAGRDFGFWEAVAVWHLRPGLTVATLAPKGVA